MKRRSFILQSGILGGISLAAPKWLSAQTKPKRKIKSAIILGAGFAGLAAANYLKGKGIKITVLEAKNRIGGRVFSHQPESANQLVIELGAEWVGASHERVIALCNQFGLELQNNQFESHLTLNGSYQAAGKWGFSQEFDQFWNKKTEIWNELSPQQKKKLDKMDWWRYLSNKKFEERDLFLRELLDSTDFGESIRHTSCYAAFAEYAESSEKNEMDLKIRGGNSKLAESLGNEVGAEYILLRHKAIRITQEKQTGVRVDCDNGTSFTADAVICTLPTASIQQIKWIPGLPAIQTDAINALQYARIGKYPLVFSERFWKAEDFDMVTDTPAHYFYHATKNQDHREGVLICYAIGEKSEVLNSVNAEQRESIILDALKPAFGDVRKYLKQSLKYYWGADSFSKGAYAFYGKNQWFGIMPVLKQPFMKVHFAGEHLADWQGFMEGAIVSGEEAAENLLG
ncbi:MAG: FAD-dependent oxidoreductase [Saprospiraceae bacterium]|nr:FAD-dependent oxidoreductase [Saprospiraceae bacterium]